ncbi:nitrogen permease regulator of amino acid transport activity 3-domain-containing protein [Phakopsora pachyrhizi]|nr:nitrogen permease regulator of amino acid transport activity 3-domain-containing protein [Phakopsora pachyrhizi]
MSASKKRREAGCGDSLLAILLVTHTEQSSPSLSFAWPPSPHPTLRLSQPVYGDGIFQKSFETSQSLNGRGIIASNRPGLQFARGPKSFGVASDSDETSSNSLSFNEAFESSLQNSTQEPIAPYSLYNPTTRPRLEDHGRRSSTNLMDYKADRNHGIVFPGSFYLTNPGLTGTQNRARNQNLLEVSDYLGFKPEEWADMLTPRHNCKMNNSLNGPISSGRKLELVIDSLAIISHPVVVSQKTLPPNTELERGRTRTRSGEHRSINSKILVTRSSQAYSPSLSNARDHLISSVSSLQGVRHKDLESSESQSKSLKVEGHQLLNSTNSPSKPVNPTSVSQLTQMMIPISALPTGEVPLNQFFVDITQKPIRSRSSPSPATDQKYQTLNPGSRPESIQPIGSYSPIILSNQENHFNSNQGSVLVTPTESGNLVPLQSFSLALIIDTPPACHLSQHLEVYYRDVVLKLTAALKRLERQNSYLTREAHSIAQIQVDHRESGLVQSSSQRKITDLVSLMQKVEESSELAKALARAFDDLKRFGSASTTFDNQLGLELLIHSDLFNSELSKESQKSTLSTRSPALMMREQSEFEYLESWKSLILLEDHQLLMEQIPSQSLLRDFVAIIKPALTLSEYKFLLDTDSNTIAEMTDHLLYWKKAKITDMIVLRNSYQLSLPSTATLEAKSSDLAITSISFLRKEFALAFPKLPHLVSILSLISKRPQQPFSSILPSLDPTLDRSNSLSLERTHVRIKVDVQTKVKVLRQERRRAEEDTTSDQELENGQISLESHTREQSFGVKDTKNAESKPLPVPLSNLKSSKHRNTASYSSQVGGGIHSSDPESQFLASTRQSGRKNFTSHGNSPTINFSASDQSSYHLSLRQQQTQYQGSVDSIASSHEIRRRQRRMLLQRSIQPGFFNSSDENIQEEDPNNEIGVDDYEKFEEEIIAIGILMENIQLKK